MKKIAVKTGWEIILPFNIIMLGTIFLSIGDEFLMVALIIIPFTLFFNYILFSIRYHIESHFLIIKSGIAPTVKININNITTVKKTNDPTASAAPTIFGRIKITEINNTVIIAPKDFDELKTELLTINPTISFKE